MNNVAIERAQINRRSDKVAQVFMTFVGLVLFYGALAIRTTLPNAGHPSFDPSLLHMAPYYFFGMLLVICGLLGCRLPILRDELEHGVIWPYEDNGDERGNIGPWLLFWLPFVPDRSEQYLWRFTLLSAFLTFFLRDQSLNWMISLWGFTDPRTTLWDNISLIGAPLSAVVLAMHFLAFCRGIRK